ncbi:MAG: hypothetical protein H0V70_04415 [Ktedonobacteraceae bacterium]|nr:hypothetical protein [Ktedonobacteraceae bacterium]
MTQRSLTAILTDLSAIVKTLADQQSIPLDQELAMSNRALERDIESQAFRAIEMLVLSAHASGLTKELELYQAPAYIEAVHVLRMSGRPLPTDL